MSESHDRTLPATPRRREDARNKGLAPTGAVLGWPAMAAVVLVALPIWFRATVSAAVAAIENIQMTGKGGSYHVFLPLIFPTVVVVVLALGVLLLVRTFFDGAAWRIDRLVFDLSGLTQALVYNVLYPQSLLFGSCFLLLVLPFL